MPAVSKAIKAPMSRNIVVCEVANPSWSLPIMSACLGRADQRYQHVNARVVLKEQDGREKL